MLAVIGKKVAQTQKFLTDGTRIPVTIVATPGNTVTMVKTQDRDGYTAVQLGFGSKKNANKPQLGHAKKAHLEKAPQFLAEARFTAESNLPTQGDFILANTVLAAGDMIDARGVSKGKGFAGGVKRYHFRGGPKTHGQSDRHRAPGSIGSGTTPGRVYKGKRMAGKMGNDTVTVKNLEVVEVGADFVWVKGVVPGPIGAVVVLEPTGEKDKKFVGVLKTEEEKAAEEAAQAGEVMAEPAGEEKVEEVSSSVKASKDKQSEVTEEAKSEETVSEAPKAEEEVEEAMAEIAQPKEESFLPEVKEEEVK